MAIRKFRKNIKPFIWVITILFVLSSGYGAITYMKGLTSNRRETTAFKLNGKKVDSIAIERAKNNIIQGYSQAYGVGVDRDLAKVLAVKSVIDRQLTLELADELNVKVPSSEVDATYSAYEKSIGNREQFRRMLNAQGFTKKTFKDNIKEELLYRAVLNKIREQVKINEDDIKEFLNSPAGEALAANKNLTQEQIKQVVENKKAQEDYVNLLNSKVNNAMIADVVKEYEDSMPKTEIEKDGFNISNYDLAEKSLQNYALTQDKEQVIAMAKEQYFQMIKLAEEAKKQGITVNPNLPLDSQLAEYQLGLLKKIKESINPTDAQLKSYFEKNKAQYDTLPVAEADIAVFKVEPSKEDKEAALKRAEEILKEAKPDNFAELAKKYSDGPTGPNGGDLGWFGKKQMVEPFEKAAFEGKAGEVYPKPVETIYGYHIIYVEEKNNAENKVRARHILITPKVSEKTLNEKLAEIDSLKEKLQSKEVSFDSVKERADVLGAGKFEVTNDGYIVGLGYNQTLKDLIFKAPLDKLEVYKTEKGDIFLYEKTSETKGKKADFNEVKNEVLNNYKMELAQKELKEMANKLN